MAEERSITEEHFNVLLKWLGPDKEAAAKKYEVIRQRLIRVFAGRGCFEAEVLADVTIDRVTLKAPELDGNFVGDPALYFYGVANNVFLEWLRKQKKIQEKMVRDRIPDDPEDREAEYRCLETCLDAMTGDVRELIVEYYRGEKRAKIERRRKLADRLGISPGALQIKTSRIRTKLGECVRDCMTRLGDERF